MALLEKVGDTILSMGKDMSQKAKDMSGIAKLKLNIRSKEDFIKEQYIEIGKAYYERHKGEEVPVMAQFSQIDEALEDIARMELQILELKGARKCPECGSEAAETAEYCSVCGAKLSVVVEEEPEKADDLELDIETDSKEASDEEEM